jgi:ABC-type phosphate transport system substrate-binding protein
MLIFFVCVYVCGCFAQTAVPTKNTELAVMADLPKDADYSSRIFSANRGGFFSLEAVNPDPESVKLHFPDDPEWGRLYGKQNDDAKTVAEARQQAERLNNTFQESRRNFARHLLESRLAEIRRLQPETPSDGSKAKLSDFDFPELDGSTACEYLGKIIAARVLGIPYTWKPETNSPNRPIVPGLINYGTPSYPFNDPYVTSGKKIYRGYFEFDLQHEHSHFQLNNDNYSQERNLIPLLFRIVADEKRNSFRRQKFFNEHFGHFQGTHQSYLSLLAAKINDSKLPPDEIKSLTSQVQSRLQGNNIEIFPFSEIILVARKPSRDELATAEKFGFEFDVRPVARDALVFLVHRQNEVNNLSLEQIRSIYLNRRDLPIYWNDFGGKGNSNNDNVIHVFERDRNSGSRELLDELVMTDDCLEKAGHPDNSILNPLLPLTPKQRTELRKAWDEYRRSRSQIVSHGMMGAFLAIASDTQGISYSVNYYEHFMVGVPQCRVIAVDNVLPSHETIRTKKYPLTADVYVVTLKGIANDSPAAKLRDWLLSEEGQRCVQESGYVPVN